MPKVFLCKCRTQPGEATHLYPGLLGTENGIRWKPRPHWLCSHAKVSRGRGAWRELPKRADSIEALLGPSPSSWLQDSSSERSLGQLTPSPPPSGRPYKVDVPPGQGTRIQEGPALPHLFHFPLCGHGYRCALTCKYTVGPIRSAPHSSEWKQRTQFL